MLDAVLSNQLLLLLFFYYFLFFIFFYFFETTPMIIPHQPAVALPWLRNMLSQVKFENIPEYSRILACSCISWYSNQQLRVITDNKPTIT